MKNLHALFRNALLILWVSLILAGCTLPSEGGNAANSPNNSASENSAEDSGSQPAASETPSKPELSVSRIAIRVVDGVGEFYDTGSGEKFVPRGVNYVDFHRNDNGNYEDRTMAVNIYDPERVREAFQTLHSYGYNTVRMFFDGCGTGRNCIANPNGRGLNPGYLDNMVDLMYIAGEEGIYILFTANDIPSGGEYWSYFDSIFFADDHAGFIDGRNADWLHTAGVETKKLVWEDLMKGLVSREAPMEVVLGWELTNEFWLWKLVPPLSLDEGMVETANGQSYDMADPEQKRQMITDGTLYFMEQIVEIVKRYDPEALTSMGFFPPQFPNQTGIGGDWYVDTAPLIEKAAIDFWDFHAYYDNDLTVLQMAENFGMVGFEEKPVVMGETGSGKAYMPTAAAGLSKGLAWIAESCEAGFDGWLNWGYYPWPADMDGPPWTFLDADHLLLEWMSPLNQPDPCTIPELEVYNAAYNAPVTATRQEGSNPAIFAVDGGQPSWLAGAGPPQWIEIDLGQPTSVGQIGLAVEQWPPGYTQHQVWARLEDGTQVLLAEFDGYTTIEMSLSYLLSTPLDNVVAVRVRTLKTPAWVGWKEINVVRMPPAGEACLLSLPGSGELKTGPGSEYKTNITLSLGQVVYADAYAVDAEGNRWWRAPSDQWIADAQVKAGEACGTLPEVEGPDVKTVPVTFMVTVPDNTTGDVMMGGSFPGTPFPPWIPYTILLQKLSGNVYSVTLDLPVGTRVEYLYNRNSWDSIERPENCGAINPRTFVVEDVEEMLLEDVVIKWHDLDGCG